MRAGQFGFAPPVHHDVAAVGVGDVFVGVNAQDLAEGAGGEQLFRFAVDRRVAQYEAGHETQAAFPVGGVNFLAVGDRSRQRLFREDVLAGGEGGENLLFVKGVRRKNHHPLHPRRGDRLGVIAADFRVRRRPMADDVAALLDVGVVDGGDFDLPPGVPEQIADHIPAAFAVADHRHFNFSAFRHDSVPPACFFGFGKIDYL
jgi:hypothetical protein